MGRDAADAKGSPWPHLEGHFRRHARLVSHFRNISAPGVVATWKTGRNAAGELGPWAAEVSHLLDLQPSLIFSSFTTCWGTAARAARSRARNFRRAFGGNPDDRLCAEQATIFALGSRMRHRCRRSRLRQRACQPQSALPYGAGADRRPR
jgi:hypothetical protein